MAKNKLITDNELFYAAVDLIIAAKKTLVLIQPNLSNIEHLLEKISQLRAKGVEVYIVTRPEDKDPSHKKALLFFEKAGCRIFTDPLINARIIIRDQAELLTSSAELSKTANDRFFDIGIYSNDSSLIDKALEYAEKLIRIIDKKKKTASTT
ncbi:MAG: hypothetical protein OdinLCB4_003680 [Candidatus Odinarchaeum yellowstonii]|jgi:sugar-specific transcriptional regulator TrmB|uniref:Phospholipase D-like domain-containing protein n=1 Tax=Odinarchaeota yellowstonii (strain LCB_4) TaxID=1841599 RepID=A0AAF0D3H2_ODILC|nr:MAG: hypothetical protein OdinLCB4_003680 [Candidatus Odinarchaeum yellowstonii]